MKSMPLYLYHLQRYLLFLNLSIWIVDSESPDYNIFQKITFFMKDQQRYKGYLWNLINIYLILFHIIKLEIKHLKKSIAKMWGVSEIMIISVTNKDREAYFVPF